MICCSCLKVYGWKDIRVKPCSHMIRRLTQRMVINIHQWSETDVGVARGQVTPFQSENTRPGPAQLSFTMTTARVRPRLLTSLLVTLLIMILSGRSMVLAIVSTTSRAWRRVGQSNRLYITFCFLVQSRSSWKTQNGARQGRSQTTGFALTIRLHPEPSRQTRGGFGPVSSRFFGSEHLTSSTSRTVVSFLGAGLLNLFSSSAAAWSAVAF